MKTTYIINEAHSGTDYKEIEKAKRHFRKMKKEGRIYGRTNLDIIISFSDANYVISASFHNEVGQEVCDPCVIYAA